MAAFSYRYREPQPRPFLLCNGLLRAFACRWTHLPELRAQILDHKSTPLTFDAGLYVGLENHMISNDVIPESLGLEPSLPTFGSSIWGRHLGTLACAAERILGVVRKQVFLGACFSNQVLLFAGSHKQLNFIIRLITFVDAVVRSRFRRWLGGSCCTQR